MKRVLVKSVHEVIERMNISLGDYNVRITFKNMQR